MPAFLFDLDQTLLDTSSLKVLRDRGEWASVLASLDKVKYFETDTKPKPHELPALLKAQGHRVGVVTNSTSTYAKKLLSKFGIPFDTLVSFHDTAEHKPDQAPLILARERLDAIGQTCFYIGDDPDDFTAASRAGITSVGASWGISDWVRVASSAPDIIASIPSLLLEPDPLRLSYAAERIFSVKSYLSHPGSVLPVEAPGNDWALGRYFQTADSRSASSPFTKALLELKSSDAKAKEFSEALIAAIASIGWKPDYIVPVPPKPSQPRNRFREILKLVDKHKIAGLSVKIDGLKCTREIEGYKQMKPQERYEITSGVFDSQYIWEKASKILLIDDVSTTGATAIDATRALKVDGAAQVRVLCFGKDQRVVDAKYCPTCKKVLRVRTNRKDGTSFYGCSGFPACKHTETVK